METLINIKDFKKDLPLNIFLDIGKRDLLIDDEIIAVFIQGSQLTKPATNSDIDIQIGDKTTNLLFSDYRGNYHHHLMHGGYTSFSNIPVIHQDNIGLILLQGAGGYNLRYLTKESFLYINPKYKGIIDGFLEHKLDYSELGLCLLIQTGGLSAGYQLERSNVLYKGNGVGLDYYYNQHHLVKDEAFYKAIDTIKHKHLFPKDTIICQYLRDGGIEAQELLKTNYSYKGLQLTTELQSLLNIL